MLSVIAYDDVEDALAIANGTEFGLAAALWSTDLNAVHTLSRRLRAGVVWVNCFEEGDMTIPSAGSRARASAGTRACTHSRSSPI